MLTVGPSRHEAFRAFVSVAKSSPVALAILVEKLAARAVAQGKTVAGTTAQLLCLLTGWASLTHLEEFLASGAIGSIGHFDAAMSVK